MTEPTTPPTEQQLDEIETRANAATPGPWEEHDVYGPHFYAYLRGPYLRGVGTLNFGDGEDAAADREFVAHARQDVDVLLAEIRRLQGQRKFLLDQLARKDAASGATDAALAALQGLEVPTEPETATEAPEGRVGGSGATEPPNPYANGVCTYGEDQAPGSGCIKPTGHNGAHYVTPGDTDDQPQPAV